MTEWFPLGMSKCMLDSPRNMSREEFVAYYTPEPIDVNAQMAVERDMFEVEQARRNLEKQMSTPIQHLLIKHGLPVQEAEKAAQDFRLENLLEVRFVEVVNRIKPQDREGFANLLLDAIEKDGEESKAKAAAILQLDIKKMDLSKKMSGFTYKQEVDRYHRSMVERVKREPTMRPLAYREFVDKSSIPVEWFFGELRYSWIDVSMAARKVFEKDMQAIGGSLGGILSQCKKLCGQFTTAAVHQAKLCTVAQTIRDLSWLDDLTFQDWSKCARFELNSEASRLNTYQSHLSAIKVECTLNIRQVLLTYCKFLTLHMLWNVSRNLPP